MKRGNFAVPIKNQQIWRLDTRLRLPADLVAQAGRRARQAAYRRRRATGVVIVAVPVDAALVELLVKTGWLAPGEFHSRAALADAIARMHAASAKSP